MWMIMLTTQRLRVSGGTEDIISYYKITHNGKVLFVNKTNRKYAARIKDKDMADAAARHIAILEPSLAGKLAVVYDGN